MSKPDIPTIGVGIVWNRKWTFQLFELASSGSGWGVDFKKGYFKFWNRVRDYFQAFRCQLNMPRRILVMLVSNLKEIVETRHANYSCWHRLEWWLDLSTIRVGIVWNRKWTFQLFELASSESGRGVDFKKGLLSYTLSICFISLW